MAKAYGIKTAEDFDKPAQWKAGPGGATWRTDEDGNVVFGPQIPYYVRPQGRAPRTPQPLDLINPETNDRVRIDGNDFGMANDYYDKGYKKDSAKSGGASSFADRMNEMMKGAGSDAATSNKDQVMIGTLKKK